jgi:hypothetical protein
MDSMTRESPVSEARKTARLTAFLEMSLDRNLAWIGAADAKTAVVFGLDTAMIGLIAAAAPAYGKWTSVGVWFAATAAALLIASLASLFAAVFPRTKGPRLSLIFFGGIADRSVDEYRDDVTAFDEEAYVEDLIQQTHVNASIASAKYRWVKWASKLLYLSTLPWLVALYILFRDR